MKIGGFVIGAVQGTQPLTVYILVSQNNELDLGHVEATDIEAAYLCV